MNDLNGNTYVQSLEDASAWRMATYAGMGLDGYDDTVQACLLCMSVLAARGDDGRFRFHDASHGPTTLAREVRALELEQVEAVWEVVAGSPFFDRLDGDLLLRIPTEDEARRFANGLTITLH